DEDFSEPDQDKALDLKPARGTRNRGSVLDEFRSSLPTYEVSERLFSEYPYSMWLNVGEIYHKYDSVINICLRNYLKEEGLMFTETKFGAAYHFWRCAANIYRQEFGSEISAENATAIISEMPKEYNYMFTEGFYERVFGEDSKSPVSFTIFALEVEQKFR
ncbi:hypothetical protein ACFL0W_00985, partial [Nanoarchaeota archaeon]